MQKIIIGIHGLNNKPAKDLLEDWWKKSIITGLESRGIYDAEFNFELCYWADLEYEKPFDLKIQDENDPLYLKEPFVKLSDFTHRAGSHKMKKQLLDKLEENLDKIIIKENSFKGLDAIADLIMRRMFKDLDIYYHGKCLNCKDRSAKFIMRQRLAETIRKHKKKKIMLIAHSMGSIISYDAMIYHFPQIKIDTFLTVGSPLGNPVIIKKILLEKYGKIPEIKKPTTPENVKTAWFNLADINDKITMNYNLNDDFSENSIIVKPIDILVNNRYSVNGEENPHKVYGYLQTSQAASIIADFLSC